MGGHRGSSGWVLRYGVEDLEAEQERLGSLGVSVGHIETFPDVISFFHLIDPDGNTLSCYQVLEEA